MARTNIYQREIYLGDYHIIWSDQKIIINCSCKKAPELEIFSESYTFCPECGRRYSIAEIIKVELPLDLPTNDPQQGDLFDYMEED